ncbi:dihydrodipicolinate synthase family protein [Aliifodinibius sp. S!AR15-10]|uniref:dihydrodipicolinate synthase family protein n=1 Tax=Aliifodinibius sp. S!AR15-10 TaxID=2950437 RepID=UPI0028570AB1|nr:dihydrodipicolinate synthase family protein [Aliifodinibius sp. S!AR15-10]MDR8391919.1 dihydrodipicolinate synthase family protein [Aliifodinibius sp. S!AR15-10]
MKDYPTKGIVPPMVTPLLDQDTLDVGGLEKLVDHLVTGGVHGLFIMGTTGEGPSLSYRLREELIQRTCSLAKNRVPVLVGITDTSMVEALRIAKTAEKEGAAALVLAPPFYFNITDQELREYMDEVLEQIQLPLFLYNMPPLTKKSIPLPMINELAHRPEVVGVKDSSGDLFYFHKLNRLGNRQQYSLLVGPEELLMETLLLGADGGVPGGANIFPQLYVDLFETIGEGNIDRGRKLHNRIVELCSVVYDGTEQSSGNIISGIKQALSYRNICSSAVAHPLQKVSKKKANRIKSFIEEYTD